MESFPSPFLILVIWLWDLLMLLKPLGQVPHPTHDHLLVLTILNGVSLQEDLEAGKFWFPSLLRTFLTRAWWRGGEGATAVQLGEKTHALVDVVSVTAVTLVALFLFFCLQIKASMSSSETDNFVSTEPGKGSKPK